MRKILLIEDDKAIQAAIKAAFSADFEVSFCGTVEQARAQMERTAEFDVIVIDRMLPDGDGMSLVGEFRSDRRFALTPIVFLSGMVSESDRVSGFFAGADDYVTKPFSILELKARILARLRSKGGQRFWIGSLEVDTEGHRVYSSSKGRRLEIPLTRTEFKILLALSASLGTVVSREFLLEKAWGDQTHVSDRVIDSHVSHLRKKIAGYDLALEAIRGEGYRLDVSAAGVVKAASSDS